VWLCLLAAALCLFKKHDSNIENSFAILLDLFCVAIFVSYEQTKRCHVFLLSVVSCKLFHNDIPLKLKTSEPSMAMAELYI
jgi:hypothetical protein